ncbi:putative zinc- or iron-chelating domain protein [Calidithermus terrae]|uniref:Putative zinc-or iron-chelating domain protein n=1 Tax=Calidithermus terrae TaxID=1408545 RepID=A0A399E6W7_9DEIN|nr:YkgJ family cysteine cluster protein [Calidithermus terrae]RIH80477.1 putative zinc- or iron-chelating domain protein [Calidithermus terrae]
MDEKVAQAHRAQDARSARYLERAGLRPSCRAGCAACCHALVTVGLAEAEYLRARLEPRALERAQAQGALRLQRLRREKNTPDFPSRYFAEANPCPLLTPEGTCSAYAARPLACRGVLTDLEARYCAPGAVPALQGAERSAYEARLRPHHGPEHYLSRPWQSSERLAHGLWEQEQALRGFTVIGELASLLYLLGRADFQEALSQGEKAVRDYLQGLGVLGGEWGFWVG